MLMVVGESCSTWKPACCSRAAALRIRSASEVKLTATSWVMSDCASNSDIPPIERGDACA
jgi:hypothetical protein